LSRIYGLSFLLNVSGISRSGYYKWLKRSARSEKEDQLRNRILKLYEKFKGIYGYRRLKVAYKQQYSETINHKKIYRLMREMGLKSRIRRKRRSFYKQTQIKKPNILNRNFKAVKEKEKLVTDITNLKYKNTTIYLCTILDLYNREILAYLMSKKNDNQLVANTFKEVIEKEGELTGTILHSDQGSQYTTEYYSELLIKAGIEQSMSRRGNCLDNAPMECFFSHLKSELIYITKYTSEEELIQSVKNYIGFYNTERIQVKLKNLSPVAYRLQEMGKSNLP